MCVWVGGGCLALLQNKVFRATINLILLTVCFIFCFLFYSSWLVSIESLKSCVYPQEYHSNYYGRENRFLKTALLKHLLSKKLSMLYFLYHKSHFSLQSKKVFQSKKLHSQLSISYILCSVKNHLYKYTI